ncbi:MAG: hypothetical protein ACRDQ0_20035, partial [Pseudonocardia sp.]
PRPGSAAVTDDGQGSSTSMLTIITKPARALRPGDLITRHPDHGTPVRYLVTRGARETATGGVLVDYTAPADELAGCTPNDRASGVLMLGATQPCEIETAHSERSR